MSIRIREKLSREEWLAWRMPNINATEAPVILGVDKYQTLLGLYHEKKAGLAKKSSRIMRRGGHMEAAILSMLREERPDWQIEPCGNYYDDPDLRIGCSPDAFAWSPEWEGRANVQLKTVSRPVFETDWRDEDGGVVVPIYYQVQTVIEAKMTHAVRNFIVPYVIETFARDDREDLFVLDVPIHDGAWNKVVQKTAAFWENFEKGIEPPLEPERDGDLIKRLYPTEDGSVIDLGADNELPVLLAEEAELAELLSMGNEKLKSMVDRREALRTEIKAKLGCAVGAVLPGWEITWKTQCRKASQSRVLRIKPIEGER